MQDHRCEPQPESPGTTLPPPWRCPECDRLWMAQAVDEPDDGGALREVGELVGWTWHPFESLTPDPTT